EILQSGAAGGDHTDIGMVASGSAGLQDFAVDYCQEGVCNFRRILTLSVVDAADTLTVLNFRQFLLEPSTVSQGLDPTAANGSFRAQYMGRPVPVRSGALGGSCGVSVGIGRVVLHSVLLTARPSRPRTCYSDSALDGHPGRRSPIRARLLHLSYAGKSIARRRGFDRA